MKSTKRGRLQEIMRRARALPKKIWIPVAGVALLALVAIPVIAQGTLFVEGDRVGIGTPSPGGDLHIYGGPNSDTFNAIGPSASTDALNFGYSGGTFGQGSGFFNVRPAGSGLNPALYFATGNVERMVIDNQGYVAVHMDGALGGGFNPAYPIHAQVSGARLTTGGVWTNASSRELKENIRSLDLPQATATLMALEPVLYNYKLEANDTQVGFIAEDVPELVATPDHKTLAPGEIVGVLTRVVQEQQRTIDELSSRIEQLERTQTR